MFSILIQLSVKNVSFDRKLLGKVIRINQKIFLYSLELATK
jgi:hypothetical protein